MANSNQHGQWPERDPARHTTYDGEDLGKRPDQAPTPIMPFPSQLVQLSHMELPASYSVGGELPLADPNLESLPDSMLLPYGPSAGLSFAEQANDMVNAALNRAPGGTSVVDPESVLGDSGRLYHGFKEGKYFLPNDAVSHHMLYSIEPFSPNLLPLGGARPT
jgi:hypothetical protein